MSENPNDAKQEVYKFDLALDGTLVENSADAYDVANTIMALSTTLREMVSIKYGDDAAKRVSLNINAFTEGSLKTQFLMYLTDEQSRENTKQLFNIAGFTVWGAAKDSLSMLHDYIEVRKWLKGKKPDKIVPKPGGDSYVIHANNSTITINQASFKALQDKTVARSVDKMVEPLEKEGSELQNLTITADEGKKKTEVVVIQKSEAKYIRRGDEEFQTIDEMRLKGVVTKIDTKVRSGYLNLGSMGARRVSFTYPKNLSKQEFDALVRSLQGQVQIYLIGAVDSNMEGQLRSIDVTKAEEDEKLL